MDLTLLEVAVLKEAPYPSETDSQGDIAKRALARLGLPGSDRGVFTAIRQLEARKYLERVSIGGFRRTHEGHQALVRTVRTLQHLVINLGL